MSDDKPRIRTDLVAAKLRNLGHYCPDARDQQPLANIIAEELETFDTTVTPAEFKNELEQALKRNDPEDYALRERGALVPMQRLYVLECVLDQLVPQDFLGELTGLYRLKQEPSL
ncbi:MAG: hypothetical protein WC796_02875 [Candidatus Pacearchaeota archaeon]|jgi:hypothetical protein